MRTRFTHLRVAIALSATATAGPLTPTFAWTATAGSFDNAASATPVFTCPATPATVTITLAVSPTAPGCTSATKSVDVDLRHAEPDVHERLRERDRRALHRVPSPGRQRRQCRHARHEHAGGGVREPGRRPQRRNGRRHLRRSPARRSRCARVSAGERDGQPALQQGGQQARGVNAACGSPMPLPASAVALTQAQVDLIAAWIGGGALND